MLIIKGGIRPMKKFIAMIMVLCMMFTMVACGGGEAAPEAAAYKLGMRLFFVPL